MKNHIVFKFLAIFLAAAALLAAVGSAGGIVGLTSMGLYEKDVDTLREEQSESLRREFAVNQIHRYASVNLGNLPETYLETIFGNQWYYCPFVYGTYYYSIVNDRGEIVESTLDGELEDASVYSIVVTDLRYRRAVTGALDGDGTIVDPNSDARATQTDDASTDATAYSETEPPTTEEETTVPEATTPETDTTEDVYADSIEYAITDGEGEAYAVYRYEQEDTIHTAYYYDYTTDQEIELRWQTASLPPYTFQLYLLPDALPNEASWTLLEMVWNIRIELTYILAASLLVLAVAAVYLCCAASRKPDSQTVHAEGLNRLPLDLYFVSDACLVVLCVVLGMLCAEVMLDQSLRVMLALLALDGYFCALVCIGFFYALCAQVKTPNGYWWKNTVIARALRLAVRICRKVWHALCWAVTHFPACVRAMCAWTKKFVAFLASPVIRLGRWLGGWLGRLYALLPLMWQWLVAGAVLLVLMLIAVIAFFETNTVLVLLCLAACVAIVLYGARSFGVLFAGVKRMSKGNLDTKVDGKHLVGAFGEFSEALNALSEVAIVAAQKQMKAERMKTELITNVSHDIKTPLTSIINYVDLLDKPHSEQEQEQYLEVLARQSQRLKKLIEDLMEMSKASTGNLAVDITDVSAVEAINQALGEFADKLERAELTPVFHSPEGDVLMRADGRLVWRVLSNLLGNAVKYALAGTRLYIDLMQLDGRVIISLKNISRDPLNVNADELLERFVRGDSARNTEGSGLGLNIAQSLMELQKGTLQLLVDGDLFKVTLSFPMA